MCYQSSARLRSSSFEAAAAPPQPESSGISEFDAVKSIASELKAKVADVFRRSALVFEASADAAQAVLQSIPQREQFAAIRDSVGVKSLSLRERLAAVSRSVEVFRNVHPSLPQGEPFAAVSFSGDATRSIKIKVSSSAGAVSIATFETIEPPAASPEIPSAGGHS